MNFFSKARAFARAPLTSVPYGMAAGAVLGLAVGGAYVAGGLSQDAAAAKSQAARLAQVAAQGFTDEALATIAGGNDAGAIALVRRYENSPAVLAEVSEDRTPSARISVAPAMVALRGPVAAPYHAGPVGQARELECLTEAVYYEARGETPVGQAAVAQVVLNRVRHPAFPKSICGVVFQGAQGGRGCQFSFACNGAVHQAKEVDAWERARRIAGKALGGQVVAAIGDATHFHVSNIQPDWNGLAKVAQVGTHIFYRFSGRPARLQTRPEAEVIEALAETPATPPQVILASVSAPMLVKAESGVSVAVPAETANPAKAEAIPAKTSSL